MKTFKILLVINIIFFACNGYEQNALVIGASSGIGHEVAKELAIRGYNVGLASRRIERLKEVQNEIKMMSPDCVTWAKQLDVTDDNAVKNLENIINEMGRLDLVVISITSFPDTQGKSEQEMNQKCLEVELIGFWKMANYALEYFKKQGTGHIVGISSVDALRGNPYCPMYSAAKAFVSRYLEGIRNQLHKEKLNAIYVTDVLPGYVQTEGFDASMVPGAYWISTAYDAALQIVDAIGAKQKQVFITHRWWVIGWLMNHLPDWLYFDVIGGL